MVGMVVMPGGENFYRVLGLDPQASREQVERAYRFSLELYGDGALATYSLLEPSEVEATRERVREAYLVLADPDRRRQYDEENGFAAGGAPVLPFGVPAPAEPAPPAGLEGPVTGAELKRVREARGVTLEQIANQSKIGRRFLQYLEDERYDYLPAPVYVRGFLSEYARVVGLDVTKVTDEYLARWAQRVRQ